MSYKINSTRIDKETFFTDVTYTFKDGASADVEVAVFAPESKEAVIKAIEDREVTEQTIHDALKTNLTIKSALDKAIASKEI